MSSLKYFYQHSIVVLLLCFCGCESASNRFSASSDEEVLEIPLDSILSKGKIHAKVDNSSTSYFIFKGEPMGFEYDLLQAFANHLNVDLEIDVIHNLDSLFLNLRPGNVDIIAANLTVTKERKSNALFTDKILHTRQVLVQNRKHGRKIIRRISELEDSTIHVRKNSSFYERLVHLSEEIGSTINVKTVSGETTVEQLIEQVNSAQISFTVADEHVAKINQAYYRNIDVKTPISFEQQVAWALPKGNSQLRDTINAWLEEYSKTLNFRMTYLKYFGNTKIFKNRLNSDLFTAMSKQISPYDSIVMNQLDTLHWDWPLVISLIYQESQFDPNKTAWTGARGLMQMMPKTAEGFGLDSSASERDQISAGIQYLKWLDGQLAKKIESKTDRVPFVLAAYNCGLGHVFDAMRLAEKHNLNPEVWEDNVELMILKKSDPKFYKDEVVYYGYSRGSETYQYVKAVLSRYRHYLNVLNSN